MLVSIIIPVYNGEKFLQKCLESVKACPSPEMECIIVNDGSTDGTKEICRRFVGEDARFSLIDKENTGVSDSRNKGLAKAVGDYTFFLDADDYIEVGRWPEIIAHAADGTYDMIAYGYYSLFGSGSIQEEHFPEGCDTRLALLSTTLLNTCWGKLLRREVIENFSLSFCKELKTCEDAIFILDFAQKAERVLLSNSFVLYYRIHTGGVMRRTGMEDKLADFAVLLERRKTYLSENYNEAAKKAMYQESFCIITDLFRSYAKDRKILEIRRAYQKNMKTPTIAAIMSEANRGHLSPFYKKLEYMLMQGGFYTWLAVYFKIKGRLSSIN